MTIEKTANGKYRARIYYKGIRKSVTGDTKKEAEQLGNLMLQAMTNEYRIYHETADTADLTIGEILDRYIDVFNGSPATKRGYLIIRRNRFQNYMNFAPTALGREDYQRMINEENCSAKTVKNAWGLVSTALRYFDYHVPKVKLPKAPQPVTYALDKSSIPTFLKKVKGTNIEVPVLLGLSSLRRSEILGLTWSSYDPVKQKVFVRGAVVPDEDGYLTYKETNKNESSTRLVDITIPRLNELLTKGKKKHHPDTRIVLIHPDTLRKRIDRICDELEIPRIGIHGLRRTYVSLCFQNGLPEEYVMSQGGWRDFQTMRKHYRKLQAEEENAYSDKLREMWK